MSRWYSLDENRKPYPLPDGEYDRLPDEKRRVGHTETWNGEVSTVFLGLDHSWSGPPPLLFETMVFGGTLDQEQVRYSTWDEAEAGHAAMVAKVNDG